MNKSVRTLMAVICCMAVSGCTSDITAGSSVNTESKNVSSTISSEGSSATSSVKASSGSSSTTASSTVTTQNLQLNEKGIRALVDENINCITNIFEQGALPTQGKPLKDHIYQVDGSKYKSYAEFEAYILSVYCSKTANMLLKNYPSKGDPKYLNIDGKLCINMDKVGGRGYYVDWTEYKVKITKSEDETCEFTLTASIEGPSETPTKEEYTVDSSAVYENGHWLLKAVIH